MFNDGSNVVTCLKSTLIQDTNQTLFNYFLDKDRLNIFKWICQVVVKAHQPGGM